VIIFGSLMLITTYFIINDYYSQLNIHEQKILVKLQGVATTLALQIDGDDHRYLFEKYTEKDAIKQNRQDKIYFEIYQKLLEAQKKNGMEATIYTMVYSAANNVFLFGVTTSDSPFFRHQYERFPKILLDNYDIGGTILPYEDENGTWLSAFAPIMDAADKSVGLLQVDERFDNFIAAANAAILRKSLVSLGFIIIVGFFLLRFIRSILRKEEAIAVQLVTNSKIIEEKNEALIALNEDKNNLLYIVAHDLRGPLGGIKGLVKIIELSIEKATEEQQHCMELINNSTQRLEEMIDKILDVNAIESEHLNIELKRLNIVKLVEQIIENFDREATKKELTVHFSPPTAPHYVNADENYLTQVYENLSSNAVKFSPKGKNIYVTIEQRGDKIRTIVRDEGPGIGEKDMKKLFGKFQKLSAKPTGGELSTGLGLSIVKKYIEAMNGRVWCESELGSGASFIVELDGVSQ